MKMPLFDRRTDGNSFDWILRAAADVRVERRQERMQLSLAMNAARGRVDAKVGQA